MPAAFVPMDIDQGEDFTSDIVWTDSFDSPMNVVHPCQMDIKAKNGQTVFQLASNPSLPAGEIPSIGLSTGTGLLQLHIQASATSAFLPGEYVYDLFATVEDPASPGETQISRLIYGTVTVNKRITKL